MFAKFFGYEFKETAKMPLLIYLGAIVISLNMGICINASINAHSEIPFYTGISTLLMIFAMVAVNLGTFVMITKRYRATMFEEQAYLTHTLPIKRNVIVLAKLLNSIIWSVFSCIVTGICVIIIGLFTASESFGYYVNIFFKNYSYFNQIFMAEVGCGFVSWVLFTLLFAMISAGLLYMTIYMCMAIGNLANKRKKLLSVGVFFGVLIVFQSVMTAIIRSIDIETLFFVERRVQMGVYGSSAVYIEAINYPTMILILSGVFLAFGVIMYFINRAVVNRNLNI